MNELLSPFPGHLNHLLTPEGRRALQAAHVVWAYDKGSREAELIIGNRSLERAVRLGSEATLGVIALVVAGTDDLRWLFTVARHYRGEDVCFGEIDPLLLPPEIDLDVPNPQPHKKIALPDEPGPQGFVLAHVDTTDNGIRCWIAPAAILHDTKRSQLSPAQIERVKAFTRVLKNYDRSHCGEVVRNLERDLYPEVEITVMESIADAFRAETALRGAVPRSERQLLYDVLLWATLSGWRVDRVLSAFPNAKGLPNLARAVDRLHAIHAKRCAAGASSS